MTIFLETERLILRHFTEDDADHLFALDSDPEVMRFIGPFAPPDVEACRARIRFLPFYTQYPATASGRPSRRRRAISSAGST